MGDFKDTLSPETPRIRGVNYWGQLVQLGMFLSTPFRGCKGSAWPLLTLGGPSDDVLCSLLRVCLDVASLLCAGLNRGWVASSLES